MKKIFDFGGYKDFLRACEQARSYFERGFRSKLKEFTCDFHQQNRGRALKLLLLV